MGKKRYDPTEYTKIDDDLKRAGVDPFAFSKRTLSSGGSLHDLLDPSKHGQRLSNDLDTGERKTPITLAIDVTGSGRHVPGLVRDDLPQLMGLLSVQGYVQWPDIQIVAFGDAKGDSYPLQCGQFESGAAEIDAMLRACVLEGGGGVGQSESYELVLWYALNMNKLQCWERGEKGYLFIVGDEMAYPEVSSHEVNRIINPQAALTQRVLFESLMREALTKYRIYYVICEGSSYYNDPNVLGFWRAFLDQNVIKLPDPRDISELVASIVGYQAGVSVDKIAVDLAALGTGQSVIDQITRTITMVDSGVSVVHPGSNPKVQRL